MGSDEGGLKAAKIEKVEFAGQENMDVNVKQENVETTPVGKGVIAAGDADEKGAAVDAGAAPATAVKEEVEKKTAMEMETPVSQAAPAGDDDEPGAASVIKEEVNLQAAATAPIASTPPASTVPAKAEGAKPKVSPSMVAGRRVQPLASLHPYLDCWTICAKVTNKSQLRTYSNARGGGSVFDMEITDTEGTQIRATLWKGVADKFYDSVEVGKVYYISNGSLKPANRTYSSVNNQYELTLTERSKIELIEDDDVATRLDFQVAYDFVKIKDLSAYVGRKKLLDIVAVATNVGPIGSVKRKSDGVDLLRRDVTLVDEAALTVTVTLWGKIAEQYGQEGQHVRAKHGQQKDQGGQDEMAEQDKHEG